jgi:AcrR family transcriptional regulator
MRSDARRNRERILDAARRALAEHGSDAQIDDIARRAGVGVGTVYRHFPNKEALLGELIRLKLTALRDRARRKLDEGGDPWEGFAGFLREHADVISKDAALQQTLWAVSRDTVRVNAALVEQVDAAVGELIERGKKVGAVRAELVVDDIRAFMCGLGAVMAAEARGAMPLDWRRQLEFMLDGFRAK